MMNLTASLDKPDLKLVEPGEETAEGGPEKAEKGELERDSEEDEDEEEEEEGEPSGNPPRPGAAQEPLAHKLQEMLVHCAGAYI